MFEVVLITLKPNYYNVPHFYLFWDYLKLATTVFSRYGGEEHLNAPPRELLLAQTEYYAEYTRYGTVIKV